MFTTGTELFKMYSKICILFGYILVITISVVNAGSYCRSRYRYFYSYNRYCTFGCCGYHNNQYCCPTIGPIIGIIVGVLSFIGMVIVITFCCCRRRKATPGVVMQTAPQYPVGPGGMTVIQPTVVMQPGVVYPQAPQTTTVINDYDSVSYQPPSYEQAIQSQHNTVGVQHQSNTEGF